MRKHLTILALPLILSACGGVWNLEELQATKPAGTSFQQALSQEYMAFALAEKADYDWINVSRFSAKGLVAANGQNVLPEAVGDWDLPADVASEAGTLRARLLGLLDADARTRTPTLAATAQVKFDCWLEEASEGWETKEIAACRNDLLTALKEMEPKPVPPVVKPVVQPQEKIEGQLFFDFDRAVVGADSLKVVQLLADKLRQAKYPAVLVTGYTDLSGSDAYNMKLSLRRADAVKRALVAAGVPADRVAVIGRGKHDPAVATKDGVRELKNRRVSIQAK